MSSFSEQSSVIYLAMRILSILPLRSEKKVAPSNKPDALDLSGFPRRVYTPYETAIEPMPKLSKALGGKVNLWVKRDDQLGLTGGGNKTRKLEWAIADALKAGADTIVTCGAVQSNHCRLTMSACVKEGLKCHLVIEERVPGSYKPDATGNNYLFKLLGAAEIVPCKEGETDAYMAKVAEEITKKGGKPYIIPGGASNAIGATGYLACAQEILHQQFHENLPHFEALVSASGSGGTHAGLVAGMHALLGMPVIGISTRAPKEAQEAKIYNLAKETCERCKVPSPLPRENVVVHDKYVGPGYSLPTPEMEEAVTLFARAEGILLDPVYTGKTAAGLVDLVRSGHFSEGSNVLFLHTGGAPSLYHYCPLDEKVTVSS